MAELRSDLGQRRQDEPALPDPGMGHREARFVQLDVAEHQQVEIQRPGAVGHLANPAVEAWVRGGAIEELSGYEELRREVPYGKNSRIDLLLERADAPPCYVEVKSTTLVVGREARFPDAVTARGLKHLHELEEVAKQGSRAVLFFLVGRDDVDSFAPADDIDPQYGQGLRAAHSAGVELFAYSARVSPEGMQLDRRLELSLPALDGTSS